MVSTLALRMARSVSSNPALDIIFPIFITLMVVHQLFKQGNIQSQTTGLPYSNRERDVAQAMEEHPPVKVWITRSILHSRRIFKLDINPFQPVIHNWSIKGCGMFCLQKSVYKRTLAAYRKEQPMWQQQDSSKEICCNDDILDINDMKIDVLQRASLNKTNFLFSPSLHSSTPYPTITEHQNRQCLKNTKVTQKN